MDRVILIPPSGGSIQHRWRVYTSSLSVPGVCIRFRGLLSRPERLLPSVTAMPIFGNNQIDDPSRAGVAGWTCSLRTGVYLSGCLRDLVPLQGKGTRDRLPGGISCDSGEGFSHSSVGSSSGLARGPSGSSGVDCSWLETSVGHVSGSVSASGLSVNSPENSWSGPEGNSNRASNTMGAISGWAGLVVKDSSISTGSSVRLGGGGPHGAPEPRLLGLDRVPGARYPPDRAPGV